MSYNISEIEKKLEDMQCRTHGKSAKIKIQYTDKIEGVQMDNICCDGFKEQLEQRFSDIVTGLWGDEIIEGLAH